MEAITHSHVCGKHRGGDSGGWTQQRVWWGMRGHQKRTHFCPMVEPLAMLEDEMHNEEAEVQGSPPPAASRAAPGASAEEVAVMNALRPRQVSAEANSHEASCFVLVG